MDSEFDGQSALVTGAGQGFGRGVAIQLHKRGATVYALDINEDLLKALSNEFPAITPVCVDVREWGRTRDVVRSLGPIDLLVNNAGVYCHNGLIDTDEAMFDEVMNVNVKAVFNISQVVVNEMVKAGQAGAIVQMSSIAGNQGLPFAGIYCASKAAVISLTKSMAKEFGPKGIRTNAVCPNLVETNLSRPLWDDETIRASLLQATPLGRFPDIQDIVDTVLFLLSDKASMTNGVALPVDGGFL